MPLLQRPTLPAQEGNGQLWGLARFRLLTERSTVVNSPVKDPISVWLSCLCVLYFILFCFVLFYFYFFFALLFSFKFVSAQETVALAAPLYAQLPRSSHTC